MKIYSDTTHIEYESEEAVFYRNATQSAWLMSHADCTLLDIFESHGKLVFVFPKDIHKKYIKDWVERKDNKDNTNG